MQAGPSRLQPPDEARIIQSFRALRASEYAEIIEECETKFVKEIEFEHFRQNFTYEEAEEIRMEFEKIGMWFQRVEERDWFGAEVDVKFRFFDPAWLGTELAQAGFAVESLTRRQPYPGAEVATARAYILARAV